MLGARDPLAAKSSCARRALGRFTPSALRADLSGPRLAPLYLCCAAELIDHAADLLAEGTVRVHESERRWRVFAERVETLRSNTAEQVEPQLPPEEAMRAISRVCSDEPL